LLAEEGQSSGIRKRLKGLGKKKGWAELAWRRKREAISASESMQKNGKRAQRPRERKRDDA